MLMIVLKMPVDEREVQLIETYLPLCICHCQPRKTAKNRTPQGSNSISCSAAARAEIPSFSHGGGKGVSSAALPSSEGAQALRFSGVLARLFWGAVQWEHEILPPSLLEHHWFSLKTAAFALAAMSNPAIEDMRIFIFWLVF